jgi:hypothetical protein
MNPLTGSIKYLIASIYNSLMALMFYIILARYLTPGYLGEIALVQLIAALVTSVFAIMPANLITREVSHDITAGRGLAVAEVSLIFPAIVFPALLVLLVFPSYVWVSLPYFLLTILTFYQASVLSGLGKFTEANLGQIISSTFRYGLAIVGVLMRNVYMIIIFWTLGTIAAAAWHKGQGKAQVAHERIQERNPDGYPHIPQRNCNIHCWTGGQDSNLCPVGQLLPRHLPVDGNDINRAKPAYRFVFKRDPASINSLLCER